MSNNEAESQKETKARIKETFTGSRNNESERQKVTKEHIQAALTDDLGEAATLISWNFDDSVQVKGDAGTGFISSINVSYSLDGEGHEINYVVKVNPNLASEMAESSKILFKTEDAFYIQVLPLINQQLIAIGLQTLKVPKVFLSINSEDCQLMIMENLKIGGFLRRNKRLGLDAPHTMLVVQELARLNAASLLVETSLGTKIQIKYPFLKTRIWGKKAAEFISQWQSGLFEDTISLAKKEGSKYDGVRRWLEESQKDPLKLLIQYVQDDAAQFSVLTHGDCWTGNVMFRYTNDHKPEGARLYDFDSSRKTSVAIDLNNLFYNSMSGTNRKAHRQELLNIYYNTFSAIMKGAKHSPPFTLKELDEECRRKMVHGILMGVMYTKMAIGAPVDQGDWNVFSEATEGKALSSVKGNNNVEEVRQRFLDIFEEMIQFGIVA